MSDLPTCALCGQEFHMGTRCRAPIPEGTRNHSLFMLGVRLVRWGGPWFDEERVADYLLTENERRCLPPLPEPEVRTIAGSVNGSVRRSVRGEGASAAA